MLERTLTNWTARVAQYARTVLTLILIITLGAGWVAVTRFEMNSDTSRLVRQDADWKRVHRAFLDVFPQYDRNTFVVVSGEQPRKVSRAARELTARIRARPDIFQSVYSPASGDFVDTYALLYLDPEQLNDAVSRLADAQPFLTAIAEDTSPGSVLQLVIDALESGEPLPAGFTQMTDALNQAAELALAGAEQPPSWYEQLFPGAQDETFYQVIFIRGRPDFGEDLPAARIIDTLESIISELDDPFREDVNIRLTGQVPLEHGEIVSALDSAEFAGALALVILIALLIWGVRSARIIAATYLSMLVGLIWTAAFAMLTVGQYNTISIIFLVMFIGLGVDFALHLCLKYQEAGTKTDRVNALVETGWKLGPTIILCGVTSAIGFLSFVPTEYTGLAEMGIISGGGMVIAVVVSLTLIPAFFMVVREPGAPIDLPFAGLMTNLVTDHSRATAWATLALAVLLAVIASRASFDYSTLSLKDQDSEAMTTLRELQDEDIITDYALTWMAPDLETAARTKEQLMGLAEVSEVKTPQDYLPEYQEDNLMILEDAGYFLESIFDPVVIDRDFPDAAFVQLLGRLETSLEDAIPQQTDVGLQGSMHAFKTSVSALRTADEGARNRFTGLVLPPLRAEIDWLGKALFPEALTLEDLPDEMRERLISEDGRVLVSITPAGETLPVEAMRRFTESVRSVVPEVTGRPVLDLGIGEIVIEAFVIAIGLAVVSIFILLLLTLRSLLDSILVFIPLAMTAMLTLAASVLIDLPLNMANVVVIPLIFGLGVGNGIHIVKRYHQSANVNDLIHCSTPRAVFLSNLTTLGTVGALSFSSHHGIYSIGVLLTVALTALMFLTIISLPALLATFSRPGGVRAEHAPG